MKRFNDDSLVEVLDLNQSTKEWLKWRTFGIGSSDIALLMSSEPVFDRTIGTLWKQRVGYERVVELDNEHIRRGKELEPKIRDEVNKILGTNFKDVCVQRKDLPYLRASLDGIDYEHNCLLEIKSPSPKVFEKYEKTWQIPENYYLQMQYQMLCSNADYCWFAFGQEVPIELPFETGELQPPTELKIYLIPVKNNHSLQLDIERRCALFMKAVETKTPIGWKDGELVLYDTNPTMFVVIGNFKINKDLAKINNFPIEIFPNNVPENSSEYLDKESFVVGITRQDYLIKLKESHPQHHIKIINLVESPFSNKIDEIELTKKGLLSYIKTML